MKRRYRATCTSPYEVNFHSGNKRETIRELRRMLRRSGHGCRGRVDMIEEGTMIEDELEAEFYDETLIYQARMEDDRIVVEEL